MSKPLSTVELPWRDWRDRGRPRPLSSFTWWWRWRRNVIVRFLSTTFSSLAMVKRMKANWTMLAMIWVCKKVMVKSIWRRVWINSQRCRVKQSIMPTCPLCWWKDLTGDQPDMRCCEGAVWGALGLNGNAWVVFQFQFDIEHWKLSCSPRCVSMRRSVMSRTILPEITSGGTKKASQERPTWVERYEVTNMWVNIVMRTRSCDGM